MNKYHQWTDEELETLMRSVQIYGKQWIAISQNVLPHLSPICLKNKYYTIQRENDHKQSKNIIQLPVITKYHLNIWSQIVGIQDLITLDFLYE